MAITDDVVVVVGGAIEVVIAPVEAAELVLMGELAVLDDTVEEVGVLVVVVVAVAVAVVVVVVVVVGAVVVVVVVVVGAVVVVVLVVVVGAVTPLGNI